MTNQQITEQIIEQIDIMIDNIIVYADDLERMGRKQRGEEFRKIAGECEHLRHELKKGDKNG